MIAAKSSKEAQRLVDQVMKKFNATKGSVSVSHESRDDGDRTIEEFDFLGADVEVTHKKYQEPDQKIVAVHFRCANRVERILRKRGYTEIKEQTLPAVPRHREGWARLAKEKLGKQSLSYDGLQSDVEGDIDAGEIGRAHV